MLGLLPRVRLTKTFVFNTTSRIIKQNVISTEYTATPRNYATIFNSANRYYSNGSKNKHNEDHSSRAKKRSTIKTFFIRLGFSLLIPYTFYAVYVSLSAFREIEIRNKLLANVEPNDSKNYEGTILKYSPLQVLGRYENPFREYRIQTVYEFFFNRVVELFERNRGGIPPDPRQMEKLMPVHKPDWNENTAKSNDKMIDFKIVHRDSADFKEKTSISEEEQSDIPIYNTWLGQSCNYVMYNGLKIITDPIFSEFLLSENIGPKRITGMPAQINEVPDPDIILVSHNHPDHLDMLSLDHWGSESNVLWIVPKGMGKFMRNHKVKNFIELSWWDKCELIKDNHNYEIACYVNDLFKRIGQRYGHGVKLTLLPCGQYCPEWHQKPRHINSIEVVKIMDDLKAKNVLGVHWGTFLLSGEYFLEPKEKLEQLAVFNGIKDNCYCPELGQTIRFD
ncbi:hypothetical protein C6P45_003524 [Maudiozyma exigua]|uniref:Metallo-beta-lactamase domain-containing protein n=1 Tax=Maudiozyma exigua TaxID=34358 RepID=A0A9P6WC80_MAUEX|nr:hypothetical protein C6P45_003524 [Kazachstania exigua]